MLLTVAVECLVLNQSNFPVILYKDKSIYL